MTRSNDLGQICSIRGWKTTGIACYFEDFGVEDRAKLAWVRDVPRSKCPWGAWNV